jgi:hypothetical protein
MRCHRVRIVELSCPEYRFDDSLDLSKVSKRIDRALIDNFAGRSVVLRGVQSGKHLLRKDQLVKCIRRTGTDRYEVASSNSVGVTRERIDLFGLSCTVTAGGSLALGILQGFHVYKPKSLERPQHRVDIWLIYDASKLTNIEYFHEIYKVRAHDGYVFKNPDDKAGSLLGMVIIQ